MTIMPIQVFTDSSEQETKAEKVIAIIFLVITILCLLASIFVGIKVLSPGTLEDIAESARNVILEDTIIDEVLTENAAKISLDARLGNLTREPFYKTLESQEMIYIGERCVTTEHRVFLSKHYEKSYWLVLSDKDITRQTGFIIYSEYYKDRDCKELISTEVKSAPGYQLKATS